MNKEPYKALRTFWDFSPKWKLKWWWQSKRHPNVSFFWDQNQQVYCRRITNVPCKVVYKDAKESSMTHNGLPAAVLLSIPEPGQLVSYTQFELAIQDDTYDQLRAEISNRLK